MDSFTVRDFKTEKAKSLLQHRRIQKFAALLRFVEIGAFLIMMCRVSTQIPISFTGFGDYFRDASTAMLSPRFVFFIGNAIVFILLVKSGKASDGGDATGIVTETSSILDRFVEKHGEKGAKIVSDGIVEHRENKIESSCDDQKNSEAVVGWENLVLERAEKPQRRELRRSETERRERRESDEFRVKKMQRSYSEEDMSNDDFKQRVEAFIARQQRFLREED